MVMTPTRRLVVSSDGSRDQIVLLEHPRDFFLVVERRDAAAVFVDQLGELHRTARAQQHIERDRALPALVGVDHVDFVEPVRQIRRVAHVVYSLPHGPIRRHRDELGLHPPPGGVFRIEQAALELGTLGRRQLIQNLFLVLLVEALEQFDRVVGFELADALRDRLRLELFEDLLADGIVDLIERREVEIAAGDLDEIDAVLGPKRRDQVAEIRLVQFGDQFAQERPVGGVNGACDLLDKFMTKLAFLIPHREAVEGGNFGGSGNVDILGHAAPRRFDRREELI